MSMYEVGTVAGAANQAKVTGTTTKWSNAALGVQQGSILVVYRSGNADLYAIKSVDSDTQLTLSRNITVAFSGASYGIITSETASTSAFANQLASAFSLWRSVVEGWSAALTSTGNITMTDPITGVSVTVPAINGMARIAGGNNLTGTQSLDSDDSGFILGMNGDIGLVKKSGTYGKLMVGKSSRFSVVRSDKDRISATDEQTEIFGVEANGDVKVANSLFAKGILQSDYQVR
ncbi:TPA: tail fiber domain-containing protein, partial [Klebsiella pneumoniae]